MFKPEASKIYFKKKIKKQEIKSLLVKKLSLLVLKSYSMFHFPRFQINFDNSLPCMTLCNSYYTPLVECSAACRRETTCFCNQQTEAGSERFSVMFNMYRIRKQQF